MFARLKSFPSMSRAEATVCHQHCHYDLCNHHHNWCLYIKVYFRNVLLYQLLSPLIVVSLQSFSTWRSFPSPESDRYPRPLRGRVLRECLCIRLEQTLGRLKAWKDNADEANTGPCEDSEVTVQSGEIKRGDEKGGLDGKEEEKHIEKRNGNASERRDASGRHVSPRQVA